MLAVPQSFEVCYVRTHMHMILCHVCVWVCMYVCMYVCIHVYICVCIHTLKFSGQPCYGLRYKMLAVLQSFEVCYVCLYVCMYAFMSVCLSV